MLNTGYNQKFKIRVPFINGTIVGIARGYQSVCNTIEFWKPELDDVSQYTSDIDTIDIVKSGEFTMLIVRPYRPYFRHWPLSIAMKKAIEIFNKTLVENLNRPIISTMFNNMDDELAFLGKCIAIGNTKLLLILDKYLNDYLSIAVSKYSMYFINAYGYAAKPNTASALQILRKIVKRSKK